MKPRRRAGNAGYASAGFSYIGVMIFVVLLGIGLALTGQVWHTAMQRENEKELLHAGDAIRRAISQYYTGSPGGVKKFPRTLEELLDDRRFPTTKRHLRRIYRDPMTGRAEWGFVNAPDGTIMGVFSLSTEPPRKVSGFPGQYEQFADARSYAEWKFMGAAAVSNDTESQPNSAPPPVNAPPPVTPAPQPPPPTSSEPEDQEVRKRMCDTIQMLDESKCEEISGELGTGAGARCEQSARYRYITCVNRSGPTPALSW